MVLINTGIILRSSKMQRKKNLASALGIQKENWGVTKHFSEITNLQFGKERHTLLCILKLFANIVD